MKTIIIPVFDGTISKNILRTSIFARLKAVSDIRIVIIPPKGKEELYQQEFGGEGVFIESSSHWHDGKWGSFFTGLFLHSIPTNFMRIRQIDWFWNTGKHFHYVGASILRFFGRFFFWQKTLRFFGQFEPIADDILALYKKWNPDVIFATTMIPSLEVSLMRLAQKDGKKIVGMAKSWDNLTSKAFLRVFPDLLIVPNRIGVEEATRIYRYPKDRIVPTGIPQYDDYIHADFLEDKEAFFKELGLDPKKRTILYAPAGDWMNEHDKEILSDILDHIDNGGIPDTQILLRLHPGYASRTEELRGRANLVVERPGQRMGGMKAYEFFDSDVRHLASSIAYTDMTINTASTMSIEAAVYDRPIILVGYDGDKIFSYKQSVIRYYDREHYVPIIRSGGAWLVRSKEEMSEAILSYLNDPAMHREGRKKIVNEECYKMDGKAADRIADTLIEALSDTQD